MVLVFGRQACGFGLAAWLSVLALCLFAVLATWRTGAPGAWCHARLMLVSLPLAPPAQHHAWLLYKFHKCCCRRLPTSIDQCFYYHAVGFFLTSTQVLPGDS
jgi:hypothetical protein